ncbi:hypothetical protein [Clostridium massiliamazoniense]|uniref:hypothetical protein n=1 Tax=Clostridium massiliamazoniense TaxID=1347366 RepID=UPI0006D8338E|nr:hypothetical protein [Clostridium massiliamazoniense]
MGLKIIFGKKTDEEIKEKEISKLERLHNLKDLSQEEKESFYYAQLNFSNKTINKNLIEVTKNMSKIMADENSSNSDVILAQNFLIIELLNDIRNSLNKLEKK